MVFFTNLSIILLVSQNVDECHNMFSVYFFYISYMTVAHQILLLPCQQWMDMQYGYDLGHIVMLD